MCNEMASPIWKIILGRRVLETPVDGFLTCDAKFIPGGHSIPIV
jgi:hypothetical protein